MWGKIDWSGFHRPTFSWIMFTLGLIDANNFPPVTRILIFFFSSLLANSQNKALKHRLMTASHINSSFIISYQITIELWTFVTQHELYMPLHTFPPWRRKWQPTPVYLPGEFHVQRSLVGCSPWSCKESDTIEWLTHTYTLPYFSFHNQSSQNSYPNTLVLFPCFLLLS